jgi:hypothetical protein
LYIDLYISEKDKKVGTRKAPRPAEIISAGRLLDDIVFGYIDGLLACIIHYRPFDFNVAVDRFCRQGCQFRSTPPGSWQYFTGRLPADLPTVSLTGAEHVVKRVKIDTSVPCHSPLRWRTDAQNNLPLGCDNAGRHRSSA